MDARKAHLHATVDRLIYVDLPPEARKPGMCARLRRCLYGTRDAPARWEAFLAAELRKMGFVQGLSSPCCFYHREKELRCVVHGDDFMFAGPAAALAWAEAAMNEQFLMKVVGRLGPDAGDVSELRVLNRVLRWTKEGIAYEADPPARRDLGGRLARHEPAGYHARHGASEERRRGGGRRGRR
jgi:hypothetical protein